MYWYSFLLPAAAAAVIILVLLSCPRLKTAELEMPGADERKFSKKDTAAILIITALYAAVAFYALGNTSSPQSFCHFTKQSDYARGAA
jgi:hypothetical protein